MQNAIYLGMKFKEKKKSLTRKKVLSLIKGELTNAKILYATKEELIEILKNERKEKFLLEFERLNNQKSSEKIEEILNFIEFIAQKLDEKQAVVALQTGLSLLNKNRKDCIIEAKNTLKEDGIYGNKTKASLCEACKNYNSRVIKKYILKGVLNNIIFNTKNETKIDTQKLLQNTKVTLEEKI
ncbi:MAG: hypothetical protein IKU37_02270 [Candidatus Gastranaerophilales bacterium]|nr:hypothetical protein [Candidatus Gastranaerophilales bacterium]